MPSLAPAPVSVNIRAAVESDTSLLRDLADRTWRASYADILTIAQMDYMLGWMDAPGQIAQELREGVVWEIGELEGAPVAFLSVTLECDEAKLNKLYVLPEHQGRGIGSGLLRHIEMLVASRGARSIWLQVNKQNERARRAYERAGYLIERAAVFDIGGGFVMDDFILRRELRPATAG